MASVGDEGDVQKSPKKISKPFGPINEKIRNRKKTVVFSINF